MNKWAKDTVFYQIYPTSFYDSNNDGIGDIKGIIEKMDYIKSLGIGAIWLNPIFLSPFMDGGYDIKDYYKIDPKFGTMEDLTELFSKCHENGIRVLLDLVIGHTSYEHEWFKESSKDVKNKYSDYYIWTDCNFTKYKDKTVHGLFERDGGYYVNYYACQPALNFGFNKLENKKSDNPYDSESSWMMKYDDERLVPLREEIIRMMEFYLEKGCDGFRVDMASSLVKGCSFQSNDLADIEGLIYLWDKLLSPIRKKYPEAFFVSEFINSVSSVKYCGFDSDFYAHDIECYNTLFRNEKGTNLLRGLEKGHSFFSYDGLGENDSFFERYISELEKIEGYGYVSIPEGSHDQVRIATNRCPDDLKCVFAFLLTLKQIPFIYYGDEIGMKHMFGINKDGGYIRTGARCPMKWNDTFNSGFSKSPITYLPVSNDSDTVKDEEMDPNSLLNTVRKLIGIRKEHKSLNADGEFKLVRSGYPTIYERKNDEEELIVLINPSKNEYSLNEDYKTVIYSNNVIFDEKKVKLEGRSFAILSK